MQKEGEGDLRGEGRVELTKELNWEKNRTEPKIEVLRIEETPTREGGEGGKRGFVEGKLCRKGGIVSAQFSGSALRALGQYLEGEY